MDSTIFREQFSLGKLGAWCDVPPDSAAASMARDEALMRFAHEGNGLIWRCYTWKHPAITIGCHQSLQEIPVACKHWDTSRRWTGGGLVKHGKDWTYSLSIPRSHPLALSRVWSTQSLYQVWHELLSQVLRQYIFLKSPDFDSTDSFFPTLSPMPHEGLGGACFQKPVQYDVMIQDTKIAGAAMRRSRHGILLQGSIQIPPFLKASAESQQQAGLADFFDMWQKHLGRTPSQDVARWPDFDFPPSSLFEREKLLMIERYQKSEWLHKHP